jgi:hypothetical protein
VPGQPPAKQSIVVGDVVDDKDAWNALRGFSRD